MKLVVAHQETKIFVLVIFKTYCTNIIHYYIMGSILSFITENFLNWKLLLFVFIQTLATFNLPKSYWSKLFVFLYTFLIFCYLCKCPLKLYYEQGNMKFKVAIFIILLYSIYTGIVPFNYPRKKYSYVVFQYLANLVIFFAVYFFFSMYFCADSKDTHIPVTLPESVSFLN